MKAVNYHKVYNVDFGAWSSTFKPIAMYNLYSINTSSHINTHIAYPRLDKLKQINKSRKV